MSSSPDDDPRIAWQHVSELYDRAHAALLDGDIGMAQAAVGRAEAELASLTGIDSAADATARNHAAHAHAELLALAVAQRDALAKDLYRLRDGRRALRGYQLGRLSPVRRTSV